MGYILMLKRISGHERGHNNSVWNGKASYKWLYSSKLQEPLVKVAPCNKVREVETSYTSQKRDPRDNITVKVLKRQCFR